MSTTTRLALFNAELTLQNCNTKTAQYAAGGSGEHLGTLQQWPNIPLDRLNSCGFHMFHSELV